MPTYDYDCPNGHSFEAFQKMTDEPLSACPECGAPAQRKISGGAGFLFKGEGFYITDYRSEDYKKRASAEAKESGEKSSDGASDKSSGGSSGGSSGKSSESKSDAGSSSKSERKGSDGSGGSKDSKASDA